MLGLYERLKSSIKQKDALHLHNRWIYCVEWWGHHCKTVPGICTCDSEPVM